MQHIISGSAVRFVRSLYPYVVLVMTLVIFGTGTAAPAHAGTVRAIDGCTTTNAIGKFINLGVDNLVNPIKQFGWVIGAVAFIVGLFLVWTNFGGKWLKVGFVIILVMVIGLPIYNEIRAGDGTVPC